MAQVAESIVMVTDRVGGAYTDLWPEQKQTSNWAPPPKADRGRESVILCFAI